MLKIAAYYSPTTLAEAVALLAEGGRTIIAGGTDLLVNPRYMQGVSEVVDIRRLDVAYIREEAGQIRIGAGATMRMVALDPRLQKLASGLLARCAAICASPNIRNMATLIGNVASALPSADTPPALIVLGAEVVLMGGRGERVVPIEDFFVGPGRSVRERELLLEMRVPMLGPTVRGGFYKLQRTAEDISLVNAAATLRIETGRIQEARLALGAVAPVPLRIRQAEEVLRGQEPHEELLQRAAEIAREAVSPISDQRASERYRRRMSGVAALRALRQAAGLLPGGEEWEHA